MTSINMLPAPVPWAKRKPRPHMHIYRRSTSTHASFLQTFSIPRSDAWGIRRWHRKRWRDLGKFAPNMPRKQDASGKLSAPRGCLSSRKKETSARSSDWAVVEELADRMILGPTMIFWGSACCKTFFNDKANVMCWCTDKTFSLAARMAAGAVWEYLIIFRFLCLHCPNSLLHQLREEDNPGRLTLRLFWTGMPKSIPKPDEVQLDLPCNGLMLFIPTNTLQAAVPVQHPDKIFWNTWARPDLRMSVCNWVRRAHHWQSTPVPHAGVADGLGIAWSGMG